MNDFEHIGSFCIPHFRRRQTALPQSVHTAAKRWPDLWTLLSIVHAVSNAVLRYEIMRFLRELPGC